MSLRAIARQLSTAAAVLIVVSVTAVPAFAADTDRGSQHIAATPSSTELTIAPGGSKSDTLDIINQGSDSFSVKASVNPYHVEGVNYDPEFTPLPGTVDASKWVQLQVPKSTILAPGKLLHVDYTVTVPPGTQPGGYYAVIFAETTPTQAAGGVVAHNRVGEILYLTVAGKVRTQGRVIADQLNRINMNGDVTVPILVQNTGGVHFRSTVTVSIKNLFGKTVYRQQETRYVLPQTQRRIAFAWKNLAPFGIYTVSRQATVPGGAQRVPDQWIVMVQPWLLVILLLLVVALAAKLAQTISSHKKRR